MSTEQIIQDYRNSVLTKYVGVASFTVLVWDHIITFSDEVEYIWKGGKGIAIYLFFLNRYLIPLSFIVNLWAYFRTSWTVCARFVRFEAALTTIGLTVVSLMMFFRVRALYPRSLAAQGILLIILCFLFGINTWLTSGGIPVPHPAYPLVDSCTFISSPKAGGPLASSGAWLPLLYDTVAFFLTFMGTAKYMRSRGSGEVFRLMLQQGFLYYSVITSISLSFTLMIFLAPPSVKNVLGQVLLCLTVTMMSRITIHLKRFANSPNGVIKQDSNLPTALRRHFQPPDQTIPSLAFATRSAAIPCSPNVTITLGSTGGAHTASGNESFAMQTFSTEAGMVEEPGPQHPPELPRGASASGSGGGGGQAEPGTA